MELAGAPMPPNPLAKTFLEAVARRTALLTTAWKTGLAFSFSPSVRGRLAGPLGPSALIGIQAASPPDRRARVSAAGRLRYREMDEHVDRLAAGLRDRHGIRRGQAAIVMLHNRAEIILVQAAM